MFLKKVECSGVIERKYTPNKNRAKDDCCNKKWVRFESVFLGHVVGERTLSDGFKVWIGGGDGYLYQPHRYFKAYLVVFNIHRKPVYVLPEDVKIIE